MRIVIKLQSHLSSGSCGSSVEWLVGLLKYANACGSPLFLWRLLLLFGSHRVFVWQRTMERTRSIKTEMKLHTKSHFFQFNFNHMRGMSFRVEVECSSFFFRFCSLYSCSEFRGDEVHFAHTIPFQRLLFIDVYIMNFSLGCQLCAA